MLRKYQEVSYLHAKKISNTIITTTKIVPSPTGELSFNKKSFPPGLYKFSDSTEEQESSSWSNRIHGNMLHLEQKESGVIDVKDSDDLYEIVPMTYFKWPKKVIATL